MLAGFHWMMLPCLQCRSSRSTTAIITSELMVKSVAMGAKMHAGPQSVGAAARSLTEARVSPVMKTHMTKKSGVGPAVVRGATS